MHHLPSAGTIIIPGAGQNLKKKVENDRIAFYRGTKYVTSYCNYLKKASA
jgi:hypothetical protein